MDFNIIVSAAESYNKLKGFIEGEGLKDALYSIGSNELEAAKMAINNTDFSQNPLREVELAVGHLQSAHAAFSSIYKRANDIQRGYHFNRVFDAAYHDFCVSIVMALCYSYLHEPMLITQSLEDAKYCLTFKDEQEGFYTTFLTILNPAQWASMFDDAHVWIDKEELSTFKSNLLKITSQHS